MSPSLVVLAAGLARRYGGCKPLAPIGPNGDAVIDLLVSDAAAAGFDRFVLVLHPETGPAIRYHVEHSWPESVTVSFAEQRLPLGTVHAVLAAREVLTAGQPFAVCNADDVYGEEALRQLAEQLPRADEHLLIAYQLRQTTSTGAPVTRGICQVKDEYLVGLTERRQVSRIGGGESFESRDGLEPLQLSGDLPTSVNLWGFQSGIWDILTSAMARSGINEGRLLSQPSGDGSAPKSEVLLPEVIARMVVDQIGMPVKVVLTGAKLLGVTHASDLPVVTAELARQVALGERPALLWESEG